MVHISFVYYITHFRCVAEVKSHLLAIQEKGMALSLLLIRTACRNKCLFWNSSKDVLLFYFCYLFCLVFFLPFCFKKMTSQCPWDFVHKSFYFCKKEKEEEKKKKKEEEEWEKEEGKIKEERRNTDWYPVRMFCFQKESKRMRRGNGNDKKYKE